MQQIECYLRSVGSVLPLIAVPSYHCAVASPTHSACVVVVKSRRALPFAPAIEFRESAHLRSTSTSSYCATTAAAAAAAASSSPETPLVLPLREREEEGGGRGAVGRSAIVLSETTISPAWMSITCVFVSGFLT